MIFLIVFSAFSAWLLYDLFKGVRKGTIPDWLRKALHDGRYSRDEKKPLHIGTLVKIMGLALVMIMGGPVIIYTIWSIINPPGYGYRPEMGAFLQTICFVLAIGTPWYFSRKIKPFANYYQYDVVEKEKQDTITKAYGIKGWASVEMLETYLGSDGPGLQIGGGFTWKDQGHIMTVGGTRGGKGVNLILPALLASNLNDASAASFVVLDPKGENLAVSGNYLRNAGYKVLSVNPFAIPEIAEFGNSRFNPFDLFSVSDPDFDKYADMIAYALMPPVQHANDYFDKSARNYITLYIRYMMTQNNEAKNFRTLYKWLRLSGTDRTELLQQMSKNEAFDGDIKDEARAIAGQMLNDGGRTVEGIYSTVRTATDIFKDMQLRESVSASDIDLKTIAKEKTAIFVCLSPSDLERCQVWL